MWICCISSRFNTFFSAMRCAQMVIHLKGQSLKHPTNRYVWNGIFNLSGKSALFHMFHRKVLITTSYTSMQAFTSTSSNAFIPSEIVVRKTK